MKISEIKREPDDKESWTSDQILKNKKEISKLKPIPTNKRFAYSFIDVSGHLSFTDTDNRIYLYDTEAPEGGIKMIGFMGLSKTSSLPGSVRISNVLIDSSYRGQGIGSLFYSIPLKLMKLTVVADDTQTASARKLWTNLNKIPGVEVRGYISFFQEELDDTDEYDRAAARKKLNLLKRMKATPMSSDSDLGSDWILYSFPVQTNEKLQELEPLVKSYAIYSKVHPEDAWRMVGLYAKAS